MFPRSQPFALSSSGDAHAGDFEDISTRTLQSVRVGQSAGKLSSGYGNAFVGFEAGKTNQQGNYNAMVGYQAGAQNASASYATMVGAYAGAQNQRGSEVTFVGFKSGELSRDGSQLVGVGAYALRENVSGNGTVAIGYRSAERTLDGYYNTMIGTESGQDNRSGNFNTMAGYRSGRSAFLGNENTYLGAFSGYSNRRGSGNSFVGYRAGEELQNGDLNVAIGAYSMQYASSGSSNIAIGPFAGAQVSQNASENVLIGTQVSSQGSPNRSVVLGALAGSTVSGDGSVLIGYQAGKDLLVGNCNILIGTGATSFSPSNNFGIAIGSFRTLTFTNSLSIGNDVTNQREFSILVGNDVSSDADNSIIVGKTNTIESFVVWKDPISTSLQQAVLNDGQAKLGLCNIEYSDTVISPCNDIYPIAVAKIVASNLVSSLTNPPHGRNGPATYDLRQYVPEHLIHSGLVVSALSAAEYNLSNETIFFTSNAVISTSQNVTITPSTFTISDIQHQTSVSAHVAYSILSVSSNIAVNIRSLSNIASSIPITCVLHHTSPILETNNVTSQRSISAMSNMQKQIHVSNIVIETSCNLEQGVYLYTPSNQLRYVVDSHPQYGSLNNAIFTSLSNITYTPYAECSMTSSDSFSLRPYYFIQDGNKEYGIHAQDACTVHIEFSPSNELIVPNFAILCNQAYILDSNVLRKIPSIPTNTYVNVMSMPQNYSLYTPYRATPYTSNDVQRSVLCNIYDYPPEAYDSYLQTVEARFSNVERLQAQYGCNLSYKLYDVIDYSTQLLNIVATPSETTVVSAISSIAQAILDLNYQPIPLTWDASVFLLSKVDEWRNDYDPSLTNYVPWSYLLTESNQAWYDGYLTSGFYDSWKDTQIASNLFATNYANAETLSNIVVNYHTNVATNISYDTYIQNTSLEIFPAFNTIFRAYFRERRIFIKYQDLIDGTIYFASNSEPPTNPQAIELRVGTTVKSIPFQTEGSANNVWSNIDWTHEDGVHIRLPFRSNVESTVIDVSTLEGYNQHYVLKQAKYGKYLNDTYHSRYPWASNDDFLLILKNNQSNTADFPVYIDYDPGYWAFPLTIIDPVDNTQTLTSLSYRTYDTSQELFSVSNVVEHVRYENGVQTFQETNTEHVNIYDPNVGFSYITSNEQIEITVTPLPNFGPLIYTCNLSNYDYRYDTFTSTWIENPSTTITVQDIYPQYVLDLSSNIEYNSLLVTITSNYFAYNCNIYHVERDDFVIHHRDAVQNRHLYITSETDIPRPISNRETFWNTTLATSSVLSKTTNYVSAQSNIIYKEAAVPITRHHFAFAGYDQVTFDGTSLSNYTVIQSNVGPTSSCTFADILQKKIWVKGDQSGTLSTSIGGIPVSVANGNAVVENVTPPVLLEFTTDYTSPSSIVDLIDACVRRFSGAFIPTTVHIYDVEYGYITRDGSNICTQCPWINRNELSYMPAMNIYRDTVQIFFSNPSTVTNVFSVPVNINFTPSSYGQVINTGISTQLVRNSLSPRVFFYSYNNIPLANIQIQITGANNVRFLRKTGANFIIVSLFSMQEMVDGRIFVEFLTSTSLQFTVQYDVRSGTSILIPNETFTFYRINHISHIPQIVNQYGSSLEFASIGENTTEYNNILIKHIRDWYSSLMASNDSYISPSSVELRVYERPNYGILVHTESPDKIVAKCTLQDILSNKLRYVSYDPSNVVEDMVGVRFVLPNGVMSSILRMEVKHFYSHFYPYALNTAVVSNSLRQIEVPSSSISMIEEGYQWTTTCNVVVPYQNDSLLYSNTPYYNSLWTLAPYASNISWKVYTYAAHDHLSTTLASSASLSVDQADYVSLASLSNLFPAAHEYLLEMFVLSPPKWGVILNKDRLEVQNHFTLSELLNDDIIYQHIGVSQPLNDTFIIRFASSPYTLSTSFVPVSITIRSIPSIQMNTNKYIYYNSFSQSNTIHPFTTQSLSFNTNGYVHVLDQSNIRVVNTQGSSTSSFPTSQSVEYGYRITSNIFDQYPYSPSTFTFTMNSSPQFYVNSLYTYEPYQDVFVQRHTAYTNQHTDINQVIASVNRNQIIAYDVNNTTAIQNALINRIVTMAIEIYPEASYSHPQFDLFLSDHFTFTLFQANGNLMRFSVYDKTWTVEVSNATYNGAVPSSLARNAWNTLKIINHDPRNNYNLSIYWKYQSAEEVNLLRNIEVLPIALETCVRYEFLFDIESPLLYVASSNYVKKLSNGVRTQFELQNSYLSYRIRNFQVNVSTYTVDDNLEYDPDSHNIIIGKDINVQGVNNICMGNRFVTSGNQSIIVGNNIGGGSGQSVTSVNDIFQSIILGNQSFRNSIVRDIICIGNENFNNLSEEDAQKTRLFFAQKPIVIGNNVDASKIDYNINIGNVFLNTTINSKQIYLGQDGQCVAIGYSSNEGLSASKNKLYVSGSTQTDAVIANQYLRTVICANAVPPNIVMHDMDENDAAAVTTTPLNTLVCGVSKESFARLDGQYDVLVTTRGKTKVWCKSVVQPGDLLVSDDFGCVVSRGVDTNMHSFTFAKSLSSWDPNNMGAYPSITTSNIVGYGDIGLISCVVLI